MSIPANLTLLFPPSHSSELNAIERVWLYLRDGFLPHRLCPSYDDTSTACCQAWNTLLADTGRIRLPSHQRLRASGWTSGSDGVGGTEQIAFWCLRIGMEMKLQAKFSNSYGCCVASNASSPSIPLEEAASLARSGDDAHRAGSDLTCCGVPAETESARPSRAVVDFELRSE